MATIVNMAEPTVEESEHITNIGQAMIWVGWSSAQVRDGSEASTSFLQTLDAAVDDGIRTVAAYNGAEVNDLIEAWTINGRAPGIGNKTKARLTIKAIRIVAGVDWRQEKLDEHERASEEHQLWLRSLAHSRS